MLVYLDSSVLLRVVLGENNRLKEFKKINQAVSSVLIRIECLRTLDRIRKQLNLDDDSYLYRVDTYHHFQENIELVPLHSEILSRAAQPFSVTLGTLDAIHLASALLYRERLGSDLIMCTHDKALANASRTLGFSVLGMD